MHVLIVGVATRAAAESAARAGYDVTALDAYTDIDHHASVRALSLPRDFGEPFSPQAIVAAARDLLGDAVVYLSNFENHPAQVDALTAGRALWGNASGALRQVRDPKILADAFAQQGIRAPRVLSTRTERTEGTGGVERWVSKPRLSGGGHGVRVWRAGEPLPRGHYLQELVEGVPGSVVFVAVGSRGVALATSRQLVGESAFGASGFRYCGSILSPVSENVAGPAIALVDAVTAAFPLAGVGAIDFIATDEGLSPVEVNPRWSASMELVERARGVSMFGIHADACAKRVLPKSDLRSPMATGTYGKAILFARRDVVVVGDIRKSVEEQSVRDVPRPGERIAEGQPICTVLAASSDEASCYSMLVERAERIYGELGRQVTG